MHKRKRSLTVSVDSCILTLSRKRSVITQENFEVKQPRNQQEIPYCYWVIPLLLSFVDSFIAFWMRRLVSIPFPYFIDMGVFLFEPRQANMCLEHSVMTNFNCACPAIQRGQGSGFPSDGSSWFTACMSEQRRFWRDCADAQARLNLLCSHRR